MALATSRPSGRRADDVRALRFRFRTLTWSGTYPTGGDAITARSIGLKRILAVIPQGPVVGDPATPATGYNLPTFTISADGTSVQVRLLEDAAGAAGTFIGQEKTNSEAVIVGSTLNALFVGE